MKRVCNVVFSAWIVLATAWAVQSIVRSADVGQPSIQAENSAGKEIRFAVTLNEAEFRKLNQIVEERNKRVIIDGIPPVTWQNVLHETVVERINFLVRDQP